MKKLFRVSLIKIFVFSALVVFAASGCRSGLGEAQLAPTNAPNLPPPTSQPPIVLADGIRASYADVVERVAPAVVNITARRRARAAGAQEEEGDNPMMNDPRFRELFPNAPRGGGGNQQHAPLERGVGSGVIVGTDGTILTNHHVVEGADNIEIELTDRRTFKARVVGSDPPSDLAVLKVEASNMPALNLGDSDKVRVGDVALAIGNPLGIGQTVTLGIISAKSRRTGIGDGGFEDFLQTDAPINRGNSGGALINLTGELIGINSQILSSGGGSIGIGFAIPSNMARSVMEQLVKNGKVRRGQLGVMIRDITSDLAATLDLKETRGAVVTDVRAGSAADKAGVKRYDVITALNGERVEDGNGLRNRIAGIQPGAEVTLTILRDNKEQQIKAKLDELSPETAQNRNQPNPGGEEQGDKSEQSGRLGLSLEPLTPELARRLQLQPDAKGMAVTAVDPQGPAADAGIQPQDVISEINRQPVSGFEDVQAALAKSGDRPVLLLLQRRGQIVFMTIQPRK